MLTRFALTIWRAATDAGAYVVDFATRRTGSAIGYLYALVTMLAFFSLLPFSIGLGIFAPATDSFALHQLNVIKNWYPDELVITVSGGVLRTNVEEPYILDLPAEWSALREDGAPTHFIVIDTDATFDDFDSYDTRILLTSTYAVAREDQGRRTFHYDDGNNDSVTITKTIVTDTADELSTFAPYLPVATLILAIALAIILPFIVGGLVWGMKLFFLAWATLILWIASVLMSRSFRYGPLFRLATYGITGSLLVEFAMTMLRIQIWWVTWVVFFVWMIVVLSQFPPTTALPPPPAAPATTRKKPRARKQEDL